MKTAIRSQTYSSAHISIDGAKKLLEKYPWLQNAPVFSDPLSATKYLHDMKKENKVDLSVGHLMTVLWNSSKIPDDKLEHYKRVASESDYFEKHLAGAPCFETLLGAIKYLKDFRTENKSGKSLGNLMVALWVGGKIPEIKQKNWTICANAADYFDKNLKDAPDFKTPFDAVRYLQKFRDEKKDGNSLSYLMCALWAGSKIPEGGLEEYSRAAGAAEYFENKMKNAPVFESFSDALIYLQKFRKETGEANTIGNLMLALWAGGKIPENKRQEYVMTANAAEYFEKNLKGAPVFKTPLQAIKYLQGAQAELNDGNSLSYLMQALWASNKIPESKCMDWVLDAGAADYFEKNLVHAPVFESPLLAVRFLQNFRKEKNDGNSLSYLARALWTGARIPENRGEEYKRTASAADYYELNLNDAPVFKTALGAIRYLQDFRVMADESGSLSYLMLALWTGAKIPESRLMMWTFEAGEADYAIQNKERISQAIALAIIESSTQDRNWMECIDFSIFSSKKDQNKPVSRQYAKQIVRMALGIYGDEIIGTVSEKVDARVLYLYQGKRGFQKYLDRD